MTTASTLGVTIPFVAGPGGGGFMVICLAKTHQVITIDHPVDQAHLQCLGSGHRAAGKDEVKGAAQAHQAGQPDRAAVDQRNSPPAAEHAENRTFLGDAQVTPERELETPGHRVP